MKRQTQVPGVRRWFGDDFLELQSETLSAIDAFAGAYNKPCVVSGCAVSGGAVAKGYVALSAQGEGLKIMPFDGAVIATPCYLVAKKTSVNSVYADGVSRLSAYQYQAVAQAQAPAAGISFVKIETNGKCDRLPDVMQDTLHRLVTDSEKTAWNAKETPTGAQTKANQAKEDAIAAANTYIGQARREARDYTDAREVEVNKKVDIKADRNETIIELPEVPRIDRNATWFYKPSGMSHGRNLYLGDDENGVQITANEGFDSLFFRNKKDGAFLPQQRIWSAGNLKPSDYVKRSELPTYSIMEVFIAGKISSDGGDSTSYKGIGTTPQRVAAAKYRVTHSFGSTNYMVNITPVSSASKSFAITFKGAYYFEVQFDSTTDFEFQILRY